MAHSTLLIVPMLFGGFLGGLLGGIGKSLGNLFKGKINFGDVLTLGSMGYGLASGGLGGLTGAFGKMNTGDFLKLGMGLQGASDAGGTAGISRGALSRAFSLNKERDAAARQALGLAQAYDPATEDQKAVDYAKETTGQAIGIGLRNMRSSYGPDAEGDTNFRIDTNWNVDRLTRPAEQMAAELASTQTQRKVGMLSSAIVSGQPVAATYAALADTPAPDMSGAVQTMVEGLSGPGQREKKPGDTNAEPGASQSDTSTEPGASGRSASYTDPYQNEGYGSGKEYESSYQNPGLASAVSSFSPVKRRKPNMRLSDAIAL